ncbi:NAD-dependent epimerase/dehydratase family protein [uncultured Salinisphaera sp.]|uniref:NAD-dependent epimerase/dehydratase family protein n=1 Tax=uncultured Salinisphaera sp. TaxID=359372 RepID=UPI0032B186A9
MDDTPVLVTGANGYLGSWLTRTLLEAGHTVHATVRDPDNTAKVGHLKEAAASAPGRLVLFAADLFDDGAFDEPMGGCGVVFHTASPFIINDIKDPDAELLQPALRGTENVLGSANRSDSVQRVVLTSSVVAIYGDAIDMHVAGVDAFDEQHWNTTSSLSHQPYNYSKVRAEKRAWEMADAQSRWRLVVINPGLVLGPSLTQASDSASLSTMRQFVDGTLKLGAPELEFGVVDVRDVAEAHRRAGLQDDVSGRHICSNRTVSLLEIGQILRAEFGARYPFPTRTLPKPLIWLVGPFSGLPRAFVSRNVGYPLAFDNRRIRQTLGMTFRPVEQTLCDHFRQMQADHRATR